MSAPRPLPVRDETSAPFWDAAARGVLQLARCSRCSQIVHPPDPICPFCHHVDPDYAYEQVSGDGIIRSWTVVRQSFLPGFDDDVPFVLVDVEMNVAPVPEAGLASDIRMIGRLLDGVDVEFDIGSPVTVVFERLADDVAVPAFALAER